MTIEQQALDLVKENEALKAQVNELLEVAIMLFNGGWNEAHDLSISGRAEEVFNSTPKQCLNSVKADAIDILGNIMEREFGGHTGSFVRLYVDKLRST